MPSKMKKEMHYFVWPPLAVHSARKRQGMFKTRIENFWSGISHQMSTTAWVNSATFVEGGPGEISDQMFTIGFKSGDKAGQSMWCTFASSRKSMTRRDRSVGPLSSWNTKFAWKYLLANGSSGFHDTYVLVLIYVSIQYVELGFPSGMQDTPYRDSAAACLYSRQYTLID